MMRASRRFVFSEATMVELRRLFVKSLEEEVEFSGSFVVDADDKLTISHLDEGYEGLDWTGSSGCDVMFSFHTHPCLFDEHGVYDNVGSSVMLSGEDLMGLVQDSADNPHFLSNPTGANVFDVVCSVVGLLVVGAGEAVIAKFGEMAQLDETNREDWATAYGVKNSGSLASLRKKIERAAWAKVENSFNFHEFKKFVGAYGVFNKGGDSVFDVLMRRCPHIGYHVWPKKVPVAKRMQLPKKQQLDWFTSDKFLQVNVLDEDPDLKGYIAGLKEFGFRVAFVPWQMKEASFIF
jgi:hypothetical protein